MHEAWLRLVGPDPQFWNSRSHFFAAAAEAMRRIHSFATWRRASKNTSC
ncbi:MAG: ECF-type sigma factor [Verrucomicrobiales bacterium]|nr:ECF-type sigma factor [Verrucomicrobiales bacterium]